MTVFGTAEFLVNDSGKEMKMLGRARNRGGFTLVELLVVMSISTILIYLVMRPVLETFIITRRTEASTSAQNAARLAILQISRDVSEAMFVYNNTTVPTSLPVRTGAGPVFVTLPLARIDMQMPSMILHCNEPDVDHGGKHPTGDPRDFPRGDLAIDECPTCGSNNVEVRPELPAKQDARMVRYFLGLQYNDANDPDPDKAALFGWSGPDPNKVEAGMENQVLLYRVEFDPRDDRLWPKAMTVDQRLSDPNFFYQNDTNICQEWKRISRVVGNGKYEDLVTADIKAGAVVNIQPTVQFHFARMDNDAFTGVASADSNVEFAGSSPTTWRAEHGYWISGGSGVIYQDGLTRAYAMEADGRVFKWTDAGGGNWTKGPLQFTLGGAIPTTAEMAFTLDPNKGEVDFAVPPGGLSDVFDPAAIAAINADFRTRYAAGDPGPRRSVLSTFAAFLVPGKDNVPTIVPGSDRVTGPDMRDPSRPPLRYERVLLGMAAPGQNQYKIDYGDGTLEFSSDVGQDLPEGAGDIEATYKIQFNKNGDVVRGSYVTKSLVTIQLRMRVVEPDSGKIMSVDLTQSVRAGNARR